MLRYRPGFFDQIGHQTTYASNANRHFFTILCHRQTYQNNEQSRQKLDTFLENRVLMKLKISTGSSKRLYWSTQKESKVAQFSKNVPNAC